jgi:hypothetical protein
MARTDGTQQFSATRVFPTKVRSNPQVERSPMKKKTVITTEKHEVWVIRQSPDEALEPERDEAEDDRSLNPMSSTAEEVGHSKAVPHEEK